MSKIKKLSNREIASFCSQISMLQQAGITPLEGMQILLSDAETETAKALYTAIWEVCKRGEPFYEGITQCGAFPDYVVHMIRLGEESGNLDSVMNSLAMYYEREEDMAAQLKAAVTYPMIMIGMMILVILVLITEVLPLFNQVFLQLGTELTGFAATLLQLGNTLSTFSIVFASILSVLLITALLARFTEKGRMLSYRLFSRLPFAKDFFSKLAAGRVASGLALTLSSGMDTYHSLDLVYELVDNDDMKKRVECCKNQLAQGSNLSEALRESTIFGNFYTHMISVGFRTGSVDSVMDQIASEYDTETTRRLSSFIQILEPTLVILLSLLVGFILLSVIMPLMSVMSTIG